ncbi:MAG: DegT/DnrJ/EryC1/StrS family aminotransferase [Candidatus Colwellbacteria bacterium]|nr:DegT/DnrJ/EryC1/StrS family aminotransferase [Candidatus Colwellbacteria bacterium]
MDKKRKGHAPHTARGVNYGESAWQRIKREQKQVVPLTKPWLTEDELTEVWKVFQSGWVSKGPKCLEFEYAVSQFLDIDHVIAVSNCTSALHLALLALGVKEGQRVIVPDYTFPSTAFALRYIGAEPILCDIDPLTYAIDPFELEKCLIRYDKVGAVIIVHPFGQCCDMDKIIKITNKYEVPLIEDAACALGSRYKGVNAGTWGDIGCFSLHARKGITTGEGGLVTTNNKMLADRIRKLAEFGITSTWSREENIFKIPSFDILGYNYKMSDILAGVGVAQMTKIDMLIEGRRAKVKEWAKIIEQNMPFISPPFEFDDCYHIYQAYVPLVKPEFKDQRNWIIQQFIDNEVQANIGTYALHRQPYFAGLGTYPVADDIFDRAIALPLYRGMGFSKIIKAGRMIWEKLQTLQRQTTFSGLAERYGIQNNNGSNSEMKEGTEPSRRSQMGRSSSIQK